MTRRRVSFDVETKIVDGDPGAHVRGAGVVISGAYVDTAGGQSYVSDGLGAWDAFAQPVAECLVIGHNLAFDIGHVLHERGEAALRWLLDPRVTLWDTQIVEYLLSGCSDSMPALEDVCPRYGIPFTKDAWASDAFVQGIGADVLYAEDPERLRKYLAGDVIAAYRLGEAQARRVQAECPRLGPVIRAQMGALKLAILCTHNGFRIDLQRAKALAEATAQELAGHEFQAKALLRNLLPDASIADTFNANSNAQFAALLFGGAVTYTRKEPAGVFKTGKRAGQPKLRNVDHVVHFPALVQAPEGSGRSVAESVLDKIHADERTPQPLRDLLEAQIKARETGKLLNTYYMPIQRGVALSHDGHLHGQFHLSTTNTGRKSSSSPNLQNIPEAAREVIVAPEGYKVVTVDFKQLELVALAYLSQCPKLMRDILTGVDVVERIQKQAEKRVGHEIDRTNVKRIIYGMLYGGGAKKLSAQSGVPYEVVQEVMSTMRRLYRVASNLQQRIEPKLMAVRTPIASSAATQQYEALLTLPTGRRLRFTTDEETGEFFYTEMKNRPVQSFATADVVPYAEMQFVEWLATGSNYKNILPIACVHDELVLLVSLTTVDNCCQYFEALSKVLPLRVTAYYRLTPPFSLPLRVAIGIGDNWRDAKNAA